MSDIIKTSELSNQAVGVKAEGLLPLIDGENYLVGVRCKWVDGKIIPLEKRYQLIPDLFDDMDELLILKRINHE